MQRLLYPLTSLTVAAGLSACASAPTTQLNESESALRAATEVGAPEVPEAAYHLKLAKDQIEEAKGLMDGNRGDKKDAKKLLTRAEADAELALAVARTEQLQEEAKRAWNEVHQLQAQN